MLLELGLFGFDVMADVAGIAFFCLDFDIASRNLMTLLVMPF